MKVLRRIQIDLFFTLDKLDEFYLDGEKHGATMVRQYFKCPIAEIVKKYGLPLRGITRDSVTYNWLFRIEYGTIGIYIHLTNLCKNDTTKWVVRLATFEPLSTHFANIVLNETIRDYLGVVFKTCI